MTDTEIILMVKNMAREMVASAKNIDLSGEQGKKRIKELVRLHGKERAIELVRANQSKHYETMFGKEKADAAARYSVEEALK